MKLRLLRASALIAIFGLTVGMSNVASFAENGLSESLPAAGFGITISEGVTVKEVKEEVKTLVKVEMASTTGTEIATHNAVVLEATLTPDKEIIETKFPKLPEQTDKNATSDTMGDELREDFSNLVIAQVDHYVNVRDIPSEEGQIVGKLYDNSVGNFIEEVDGWYKIQSGNCTGYVKGEYCVTGEDAVDVAKEVGKLIATVNTTTLFVREEATTESACLGMVGLEDDLIVTEELEDWVKVDIEEGFGYVSKDYVTLKTEFVTAESKEEEEARLKKEKEERDKAIAAAEAAEAARAAKEAAKAAQAEAAQNGEAAPAPVQAPATYQASGSGTGADVANYALQFVGNPYVFGGSSLTNGTDCSGFVMSVYANFGVSLPHSSSGDRSVGYDVGGLENAQAGDIICYSGHVGIYIGNGQIVHASTSKTGIVVGNATYRTPLCVRRIF
ncbi:MAG: C40 family peptidase [Lachnospiraceae bacterium]|nr:C40 family peptidase [Lachnospiraceae bacterium]